MRKKIKKPLRRKIVLRLPDPDHSKNAARGLLLPGWQDFFNPNPRFTLKHEVLQVKLGASAICRCEQITGGLLNAFVCQGGVVKVLLDHSLRMGDIEQVKKADNNGTMLVEEIFLQQVIHDRVRK